MITTNLPFANTSLPVASSFREQILSIPSLLFWFQVNTGLITGGSTPSQLADKKGSAAILTQGTANQRGTVQNNAFGQYPGLLFDGSNDEYLVSGITSPDTNNDFSWCAILAAENVGASTQFASNFAATNVGSFMGLTSTGQMRMRHGSGQLETDYTSLSRAVVVIGKSAGVLRMRLNGGPTLSVGTNNAGSTSTLRIGRLSSGGAQPFKGLMSDFMHFNADLFGDMSKVRMLEKFAARAYGISLA
ncbi:LamG domain-containing protein [Pseudotabrizicola algicola]|uniref:LamG domain-containing protein n=1 Tax=Pseudotabrizicola algicola TaxID=2709381 RepID=A0A6B3RJ11_9RHOB|nr:LamG domain-containing protein [Pseudotabrizicola algicola]NEX45176.1 LamG domain-containing protein [Pseudotabrizicola algicola]